MALPAPLTTLADYLAWEQAQEERHEFYRGEVFAMVGGRRVDALVALNLGAALKLHLRGSACRAFVETLKVQVGDDIAFYPDVFVTCDAADLRAERVVRNPLLVIEILSASTQAYDRGLKFAAYRQLKSLREYVLVDPDTRGVEVYRRNERGLFELHDQTGAPEIHLGSVEMHLAMTEVFDGLDPAVAARI